MEIPLYDYQLEALSRMKNGCILCGGVGSGKSRTSLAYYFTSHGGSLKPYKKMTDPIDLYIITTARKRDMGEWEQELAPFLLSVKTDLMPYDISIKIDSWNNITKYKTVAGSFFIFDEQRVTGKGPWVDSFIKIASKNEWILLSATPGDTWTDYYPVFRANGFFKNKTDFNNNHVIWARTTYPKVDHYLNVGRLMRLRNNILVDMNFHRETEAHWSRINTDYDVPTYMRVVKDRWDIYKNEPAMNASALCLVLRKVVNSDPSRMVKVREILEEKRKAIIFYNYDYELEALRGLRDYGYEVGEWNGHLHQDIPSGEKWVYLVQYNAGAEGWNCTKTDTMIFYSQNYSYKMMIQAAGRIDRLNTPYHDLYYYQLTSKSRIDGQISLALKNKKKFNEEAFVRKLYEGGKVA